MDKFLIQHIGARHFMSLIPLHGNDSAASAGILQSLVGLIPRCGYVNGRAILAVPVRILFDYLRRQSA